ncbi:hypothetical protein SAMN05192563_1003188 [Paraburkholderia aspalathi]|uniref:Uncharacterized protein n=1 Tax=Paraburkholderia aspalathi TaxID=1324617 RepID=A0A1I7A982_9BURK|nr:hypothetical protein SAMN05192563_1003188 [Paraburkholderia aspalathi]
MGVVEEDANASGTSETSAIDRAVALKIWATWVACRLLSVGPKSKVTGPRVARNDQYAMALAVIRINSGLAGPPVGMHGSVVAHRVLFPEREGFVDL